jgi:galactofuranosylgalactofuranosylrhamnosyl-N-acetylglucosaminyl-diphospho-decaprenol beta-1,5/1,6-galactofuranosyltransferase
LSYTVQNVVFPAERDPDILPLYVDPETWATVDDVPVRLSQRAHMSNVLSRSSARILPGRRVSFATYFNAFPASYWQHWTNVREVTLRIRTSGPGTVLVYRSNGQGISQRVESREVTGDATTTLALPLSTFGDGGWYWFDIMADDEPLTFSRGEWTVEVDPVRAGKASLGITTFNKPAYCVETLRALGENPDVLAELDRVFLTDQGTDRVDAQPDFDEVAASLGGQLVVLTQANLGGSGGFSRAMAETLQRPESDFVLLLDDDVKIEPESVLRAIAFGRYTSRPTLVGAHMFDLLDRPKLHAWAEVVDNDPFMWRALFNDQLPHDFSVSNLRQTPWLHQRLDADYNGWWMCLIPTEVIRQIGLSIPGFIKWDDAEFCLRAGDAGFPTVSMPGVALWHVSWVDKDDTIDWQAYFHARNRFVAALLHSRERDGGRLIVHSRRADLKHLLSMQYSAVALRHRALRDVLSGPEHMHARLATALPDARRVTSEFPETHVFRAGDPTPVSRRGRQVFPVTRSREEGSPTGLSLRVFMVKALVRGWLRGGAPADRARPDVELAKADATWWHLPAYNSALVSTADGSGKTVYVRDRRAFRRMLLDSVRLHRQITKEWPRLSAQYRSAAPEFTSPAAWQRAFATDA